MKRLNLLVIGMLISSSVLFAGGLVTNTNQSAAWARTLSRNATLGLDGVYFNPAGLAQLNNGLHLSLSNQSIFQTRTITSDYMFLSGTPKSYEAELTAPIFPSFYAAYKMDKWTFSAGFNIIGGGGSADFQTGLPSFEIPVASIQPGIESLIAPSPSGIEGYNINASFKGSSTYFGYQLGATYAINDMISVAIGGRLVTASNSYEGALTGITLEVPVFGGAVTAGNYLRGVAASLPSDPAYDPARAALNGAAGQMDIATADAYLNAIQTGTGFTPIIGVNLHLTDMINIAAKYEHHTKIELTNETETDDVGMFPDGEKTRADLPGMFTLGAQVKPLKKLTASVGFDYFLDKPAFYGNMNESGEQIDNETTIDQNAYTFSAALEYKLLGILGISAGYSTGNLGVNDSYQSGLSYALKSNTVGGGVFVDVGDMITLNAGVTYVMYDDYSKSQSFVLAPTVEVPYTDTYAKNTMIIAVGVDFSF
ncbi:MAG: hypothetical protein ABFS28_04180 [Bacteroidota bacterium]